MSYGTVARGGEIASDRPLSKLGKSKFEKALDIAGDWVHNRIVDLVCGPKANFEQPDYVSDRV